MSNLKKKSIDGIIWNLIERYGIQIFNLFIGIILARLLTPADYGLIGMMGVFFAIAMVFVDSGFGVAFIQKLDSNETDASTVFYFNLLVSLFFYLLLWYLSPFIADFYEQEQLIPLIRVAAIVLIINAFRLMQLAKLKKEVNFKKKAIISLASSIISGMVGISAALNNYGVWSLVFQQIASAFVNTCGLWIFYKWRPRFVFSFSSIKTMFSFSSWILLSNILKSIFDSMYVLAIGKYFPVAQLGFYTKADNYRIMVTQQPALAVGIVSFPVFSKLQNDPISLKKSMRKFAQHTLFFISFISSTLMVIAEPLFLIVLTEKWLPMVPYFQLLLIVGIFYPLHSLNVQLLIALGKTKLNFRISIIKNILILANIFVMHRYGLIYIIYGQIIVQFLSLIVNTHFTAKLIGYSFFLQLKDQFATLITSGVSIVIAFSILQEIENSYYKIVFGSIIIAVLYAVLQYLFNKRIFSDTLEIITHKLIKNKS